MTAPKQPTTEPAEPDPDTFAGRRAARLAHEARGEVAPQRQPVSVSVNNPPPGGSVTITRTNA